ncbi:MAG: hypothetical protein WBW38_14925 [Candidatus Sulfotelmatobacter sp.]
MSRNRQRSLVLGLATLGLAILGMLTLAPPALGQSSSAPEAGIPVPTDWSHRHVIFSRPGTTEQAAQIEKDPRYWLQRYRSQLPAMAPAAENRDALAHPLPIDSPRERESKNRKLHRDWAVNMGTSASSGADNFPATFQTVRNTASCGSAPQPDFVIYSTGLEGSAGQASIVAYDNLYSGCTAPVPSVYWAYNTGGQILTSPVYSLDGTQVAFVQTNGGDEGTIVLLKWAPSTTESVGSPQTLNFVGRGAYETCASPPCMTGRFLKGSTGVINNDTTSSVFYDYGTDTAYVGDALGWLHKFTPFFNGPLGEVRSGGWPVQVNPGNPNPLDSPVYDFISGNVFVGDLGGYLYKVNSSTASVTTSGQLDFGAGIIEGPTVNPTLGLVYVFASSDGGADCPIGVGGTPCAAVYQLGTSFAGADIGSEAEVGTSVLSAPPNPNPLYGGDFDNNYRTSANGTGNLYVCGNTGLSPTIYQIEIQNGVMGTVNPGPALASGNASCSPVTDILNPNVSGGATEWIFASAQSGGVSSACGGGGCIFNFRDTPWQPSTAYSLGQEILDSNFHIEVVETAGTSGGTVPFWATSTGKTTTDGGVTWLDQGPPSAITPLAWVKNHSYTKGKQILDSNNNIELVTTAGTSGLTTAPVWSTTPGGTTHDGTGTLVWTNIGAIATFALPAAGGTSGIVIDNTLETLTGASQVYFSTLSTETCSTSGTSGGCAVQASQSALQ